MSLFEVKLELKKIVYQMWWKFKEKYVKRKEIKFLGEENINLNKAPIIR